MMMAGLAARDPAVDRSLRSVFVGNIPYEATEEQLKDIFSEVGPVVSFRLVYDRETGKPKGYGFCEYQDQETALSAMRNLNGREFSGRALRVDNAASEKNKEELKSLGTGAPIIESPYGDSVLPDEAPESISRAVASLPPEQMFELMKQMKLCIQNSPQEARNMLLQNPQLAYALLQAQVVMRIVDPEIALKMLHRQTNVPSLAPSGQPAPVPNAPLPQQAPPGPSQPQQMGGMHMNGAPPGMQPPSMQAGVPGPGPGSVVPGAGIQPQIVIPQGGPLPMERGQVPMQDPRGPMQRGPPVSAAPLPRGLLGDGPNDPRGGTLLSVTGEVEPRGYLGPPHQGPPMHHVPAGHENRGPPPHELRGGPMGEPRGGPLGEPRGGPLGEPRGGPLGEVRGGPMGEPRGAPVGMMGEPRGPMLDQRGPPVDSRGGRDPRGLDARGPGPAPRGPIPGGMQGPGPHSMGATGPQGPRQGPGMPVGGQSGGFSPGQGQVTPQDHEKAALIMQVLQLTPDQIAMLPPEQRQSILILKEQIQKSTGAS
ncbi:cleavage stimulation factor subunit 2 isoform X2 [Latimeria chalumnae]|uniref:cleavage stimulation factor subunit 2 isoform X2 n=1 Tax=Latimeria chalumnae TaxID=7897 RepID=UPI00313EA8BB